jgi:DNA primase
MSENEKNNILKEILGLPNKEGSAQLLFYCPKCEHHKKKLSVNLEKGYFKCWVCDWSGRNLYKIIRRHGSYQQKQHWRRLTQQVEINNFAERLFGEEPITEEEQNVKLPHGFVSLVNKNLPSTSRPALNYLESRGITKKDIFKWKIGYCAHGEYASRIVVPSFDIDGNINYYIGRTYSGAWSRYLNPKISKNIIFNHLYVDFDEDLVIVEGVFDAIKAGQNSIPLLGSTLTENSKLFMEIVNNDTPVYLALDSDANKKTNKLIKLFLKYDIEIYNVDINPYSDVGEMTNKEFTDRKDFAAVLTSDNYLLNRIRSI